MTSGSCTARAANAESAHPFPAPAPRGAGMRNGGPMPPCAKECNMADVLMILSLWLHALATAVLIGNFLLLSFVYLPALEKGGGAFLADASRRSRPWLYAALIIFALSGGYLTLVDT